MNVLWTEYSIRSTSSFTFFSALFSTSKFQDLSIHSFFHAPFLWSCLWDSKRSCVDVLGRETCRRSGWSRVLLRFITAAITGDGSPLLILTRCHLLSPESYWKSLSVPSSCVPLSLFCPVFWRLCLPPNSLSFLSLLTRLPSPWILFVLQSFASSVSLLFTLIWRCRLLSLLPRSVRADISGAIRQVVRCDFTRLRETRDEKRSVKGSTSTS